MVSSLELPRCVSVPRSDQVQIIRPLCSISGCRCKPPRSIEKRVHVAYLIGPQCLHKERRPGAVLCHSTIDRDFVDAINETSNQVLSVMLDCNKTEAANLAASLQETRQLLEEEGDADSSLFLKVLQGMLQHTLLKDADKLDGMYAQALNRIYNQVAGSEWKLIEEGKNPDLPQDEEPRFSTWEEATGAQQRSQSGAQASASSPGGTSATDRTYYRLLDVSETADAAEIKAAYRKQALRMHPDVSNAPDATQQFTDLSNAYDVLSDPKSRALYDEYGPEGMQRMSGATAGSGNARQAWDEFKPYKKKNKHTKARDRARASASSVAGDEGMAGPISSEQDAQVAEFGDVVEYPLREVEMRELQDGRIAGVGLVVGRNMDRGDAAKLPEDQLDLCEIEPLRQEEAGSTRWLPDDLGIPSFARLHELRRLPVAQYDGRHDIWTIEAALSQGCGGPELPEEIML